MHGFPIFAAAIADGEAAGRPSWRQSRAHYRHGDDPLQSPRDLGAIDIPEICQGLRAIVLRRDLSFSEKIAHWRAKPATSVQLIASVLLLSLLAARVG
ncbi:MULTISPECIES: hypothetical protein [Bradyrhizobium]|uniref:hypothetical protein n=1 Tax=Bradyrhizobium TaxID=374 RepID=UPI001FE660A9|nr:hypothetical protein [Bradyrhizobium liaoningense]